jgi:16S rRNA (uracil1498-N3)-methyltransferase
MRQFFVNEMKATMTLMGDEAWHALKVLRLKIGSEIEVVSPDGQAARVIITDLNVGEVVVKLQEIVNRMSEPPIQITLAQSLSKGDKFDYIVQKAVELGVHRIIPLLTEHCVVKYDAAKQQQKTSRWQKIASEAAKQCRRTLVPIVQEPTDFNGFLAHLAATSTVLLFYEQEDQLGVKQILRQSAGACSSFVLIVGPEGGFSKTEVAVAIKRGAHIVSLGPRILRTETAATAALTVVMYECGDLGGPSWQA